KGVSTLYNGNGVSQSLVVTIPQAGQHPTGTPTGSAEILAFNAVTGQFQGKFQGANSNVITVPGLWGSLLVRGTLIPERQTSSTLRPAPIKAWAACLVS